MLSCVWQLFIKANDYDYDYATNRFFTNDDWQCGWFENFESDHQYESNLESDVQFEIESNHEASQVPKVQVVLFS